MPGRYVEAGRKRQKISYNKRVELNPDFKILWDKISQRTRYSVEFKTNMLIEHAVSKIKSMPDILSVKIRVRKRFLAITESGVEGGHITKDGFYQVGNIHFLPDLLAFLQRETKS